MEHVARVDGRVRFCGFSTETRADERTGLERPATSRDGYVEIVGADGRVLQRVAVWTEHLLHVSDGAEIAAGAPIASSYWTPYRERPFGDERSGAAHIRSLLEARHPRHRAVLARFDGTAVSRPGRPRTLGAVRSEAGEVQRLGNASGACLMPHGTPVAVGDALTQGARDHHELVALWGRERFESHLFDELAEVFSTSYPRLVPAVLDLLVREAVVDTPEGPRLRPLRDFPERGARE